VNKGLEADANSRFAQAGFSGDVTLGSSMVFGVHLIDLCFKNPRLRQAAKRYALGYGFSC
jgi:hypothetical protein